MSSNPYSVISFLIHLRMTVSTVAGRRSRPEPKGPGPPRGVEVRPGRNREPPGEAAASVESREVCEEDSDDDSDQPHSASRRAFSSICRGESLGVWKMKRKGDLEV